MNKRLMIPFFFCAAAFFCSPHLQADSAISINIKGNAPSITGITGSSGFGFPVVNNRWNEVNPSKNTVTLNSLKDSEGIEAPISLSVTTGGLWWYPGTATPSLGYDNAIHGYSDGPVSVTLSGIPYKRYDLYVYHNADVDCSWSPIQIGSDYYSYVDGQTGDSAVSEWEGTPLTGDSTWGASKQSGIAFRQNTIKIEGLTLSDLTFSTAHDRSGTAPFKKLGNVSAFQIVDTTPSDYIADVSGAGTTLLWSTLPWSGGSVPPSEGQALVITLTGVQPDTTLTLDSSLSYNTLLIEGEGPFTLVSDATPRSFSGALSLIGVTGDATIDIALDSVPLGSKEGVTLLSGDNTFSDEDTIFTFGTYSLASNFNGLTSLRLQGANLAVSPQAPHFPLILLETETTTLFTSGDLVWEEAISGSGNLTKAGTGLLTFTTPKTFTGTLRVEGGSVKLVAENETPVLPTAVPITVVGADNALILSGNNALGAEAGGLISLQVDRGSGDYPETPARFLIESGEQTLKRNIDVTVRGSIEVAEEAALTLDGITLETRGGTAADHTDGPNAPVTMLTIGKTPEAESQPTITLKGAITLKAGSPDRTPKEWCAAIRISARLLGEEASSLTSTSGGHVYLEYGDPADATDMGASFLKTLGVTRGHLHIPGVVEVDGTSGMNGIRLYLAPRRMNLRPSLTTTNPSFNASLYLHLEEHLPDSVWQTTELKLFSWRTDSPTFSWNGMNTARTMGIRFPYWQSEYNNTYIPEPWEARRNLSAKSLTVRQQIAGIRIILN